MVNNLPTQAGDARVSGSIPRLGRFLGEEVATHSSILAWKMLYTEKPGGHYSSWGDKSQTLLNMHICTHTHTHILYLIHVSRRFFFFFKNCILDQKQS